VLLKEPLPLSSTGFAGNTFLDFAWPPNWERFGELNVLPGLVSVMEAKNDGIMGG
jgi:hypothetical protein